MTRSEVLKSNARRMMGVTNIWWIEMVLTSLRLVGNWRWLYSMSSRGPTLSKSNSYNIIYIL